MTRGELRIYFGAAPGVGKTFAMLNEGWRRSQRGTDVVVGIVESHNRQHTIDEIRDLEVISSRACRTDGGTPTDLDLEQVLRRHPDLCLVDDLARTNAPGATNPKRWQDVDDLLDAGIDVITTLNVQHLESLSDVVERITGVATHETIPDSFVRSANQIELIDMSPEALRRRLAHGNVFPANRIDSALADYFRPGNLGALRELALMWVADRVEETLHSYLQQHGITDVWETRERIVVAVSGAPSSAAMVRRGARMAGRTRGDLIGVHIIRPGTGEDPDPMFSARALLVECGGSYHEVVAEDRPDALLAFARSVRATRVIVGASGPPRLLDIGRRTFAQRVIAGAGEMEVHVIGSSSNEQVAHRRPVRRTMAVRRRNVTLAWILAILGLPLLTVALAHARHISLPTVLLAFLTLVLSIGAIGGRRVSVAAAIVAALIANWYFIPPFHALTIRDADNAVALVMFLLVAGTVGTLVEQAAQRAAEAELARSEAEALARTSATLATDTDPLPRLVEHLRSTFGFTSAAVLRRQKGEWEVVASAGEPPPQTPDDGAAFDLDSENLSTHHVLVLTGRLLGTDDRRVMGVFAAQFAIGLHSSRLARENESAQILSEVDQTRTALLQAVSHDLRSPLAAIKTFVSGLRSKDVQWTPEQMQQGLAAIDTETDRLNRLVGNLLDAARLQAGESAVDLRPTDVGEVVSMALTGQGDRVETTFDSATPLVHADAAMLERSLANLVSNALRYNPAGFPVLIDVAPVGHTVHIRVVDRGPGIPPKERTRVVAPFQRLGDRNINEGVGLGLAVASGFVRSMGGTFELDDTPGGGLTVTIILQIAMDQPLARTEVVVP